jgi:hypothetical protein
MIKFKYIYKFSLLLLLTIITSCTTNALNAKLTTESMSAEAKQLISIIQQTNKNVPETLQAYISLNANINKVAYNVAGAAYFVNNPRKIKLKLNDLIFKSPMLEILQDNNLLKIYSVAEETVFKRDVIKLKKTNLLENNIDFITSTALGQIPLIENYKVKKVAAKPKNIKLLLIENINHYQTIAFKNDQPNKIMIVNKINKDRLEISLLRPIKVGEYKFFRRIRGFSKKTKNKFTVNFSRFRVNKKVNHKRIFKLSAPKNAKFR